MLDNDYGMLRETSDIALAKTGGKGYHVHVSRGGERSAVADLKKFKNNEGLYLES